MVFPEKYVKDISAKIETEYKRNPSGTVVVSDEEKYEIDFKTMTETCLTTSQSPMKVYRRPCEGIKQSLTILNASFLCVLKLSSGREFQYVYIYVTVQHSHLLNIGNISH